MGVNKNCINISKLVPIIIIGLMIFSFAINKSNVYIEMFSDTPDNLKISSDTEPNNDFNNAVEVYSGDEWSGSVDYMDDPDDYYKIYLESLQILEIIFDSSDYHNLYIYNPDLELVYFTMCDHHSLANISWTANEDGYHYIRICYDIGNSYTMNVSIPGFEVGITHPKDISYKYGDVGNVITWKIIDYDIGTASYTIKYNSVVNKTGSWSSGVKINHSIDGLLCGIYNITIEANDGKGDLYSDSVDVYVGFDIESNDNFNEAVEVLPDIEWSGEANYDDYDYYKIYLDLLQILELRFEYKSGMDLVEIKIYDPTQELLNETTVSSGNANLKIVAIVEGYYYFRVYPWYEVYYNLTAIIPGEVNGLIIPAESFSYEYGFEGNTIIWKIIDKNVGGTTYSIKHDDIINETGSWISNIDIIHNIDGLFIGNHNISIEAYDGLGDFYFDNVSVDVFNKAPMIEYQGNTTIIKGSQGNYLKWNISDYSINPSNTSYIVYKNSSLIVNNTWQKGSNIITYPIDNLTVGNYEFKLIVNDGLGIYNEHVEDFVNIQVIQNTIISINYPSNITCEHYDKGNSISWDITDSTTFKPTYIIYHDGVENKSGTWQSGVMVDHSVDGLDIGVYNISIIAFDGCGLNITSWAIVNVTPCINPILIPPIPEEVYLLGKSLNLRWIVLDDTINTSYTNYSIYHNDILNKTGTWQSNDTIIDDGSFNISGLRNITIMVFDGFGKNATDSLIVTILQPNNNQWQNLTAGSHVLWCADSDEIYIRMSLTNTNNCSVKINGSINDPLSTSFDKGLLYYSVEVTNSLNVVFPVTTRFYIPASILGSYPRGNLTLYHYNGTDWEKIHDIELYFPSDQNWVEYSCPSFSFYALGLISSSSDGGNGDGDDNGDDDGDSDGNGNGDGSDDFWNNIGGIHAGISICVGAGIIIGIIIVINAKATEASGIDVTHKTKKKIKKMKLKFEIDKLRNIIQDINEIIEELSETQKLKLKKQIKKIIKKIIQKEQKSIEELAGELIKSHLLIKRDNFAKAERKTKRVLKIAKKQNFEIIIKEANNIIKKIHKKSEEI